MVNVIVRVNPVTKSSPSCHAPPTPLKVMELSRAIPFDIMIEVPIMELKVRVPV